MNTSKGNSSGVDLSEIALATTSTSGDVAGDDVARGLLSEQLYNDVRDKFGESRVTELLLSTANDSQINQRMLTQIKKDMLGKHILNINYTVSPALLQSMRTFCNTMIFQYNPTTEQPHADCRFIRVALTNYCLSIANSQHVTHKNDIEYDAVAIDAGGTLSVYSPDLQIGVHPCVGHYQGKDNVRALEHRAKAHRLDTTRNIRTEPVISRHHASNSTDPLAACHFGTEKCKIRAFSILSMFSIAPDESPIFLADKAEKADAECVFVAFHCPLVALTGDVRSGTVMGVEGCLWSIFQEGGEKYLEMYFSDDTTTYRHKWSGILEWTRNQIIQSSSGHSWCCQMMMAHNDTVLVMMTPDRGQVLGRAAISPSISGMTTLCCDSTSNTEGYCVHLPRPFYGSVVQTFMTQQNNKNTMESMVKHLVTFNKSKSGNPNSSGCIVSDNDIIPVAALLYGHCFSKNYNITQVSSKIIEKIQNEREGPVRTGLWANILGRGRRHTEGVNMSGISRADTDPYRRRRTIREVLLGMLGAGTYQSNTVRVYSGEQIIYIEPYLSTVGLRSLHLPVQFTVRDVDDVAVSVLKRCIGGGGSVFSVRVPADGFCWFNSIQFVTGFDAAVMRDRVVELFGDFIKYARYDDIDRFCTSLRIRLRDNQTGNHVFGSEGPIYHVNLEKYANNVEHMTPVVKLAHTEVMRGVDNDVSIAVMYDSNSKYGNAELVGRTISEAIADADVLCQIILVGADEYVVSYVQSQYPSVVSYEPSAAVILLDSGVRPFIILVQDEMDDEEAHFFEMLLSKVRLGMVPYFLYVVDYQAHWLASYSMGDSKFMATRVVDATRNTVLSRIYTCDEHRIERSEYVYMNHDPAETMVRITESDIEGILRSGIGQRTEGAGRRIFDLSVRRFNQVVERLDEEQRIMVHALLAPGGVGVHSFRMVSEGRRYVKGLLKKIIPSLATKGIRKRFVVVRDIAKAIMDVVLLDPMRFAGDVMTEWRDGHATSHDMFRGRVKYFVYGATIQLLSYLLKVSVKILVGISLVSSTVYLILAHFAVLPIMSFCGFVSMAIVSLPTSYCVISLLRCIYRKYLDGVKKREPGHARYLYDPKLFKAARDLLEELERVGDSGVVKVIDNIKNRSDELVPDSDIKEKKDKNEFNSDDDRGANGSKGASHSGTGGLDAEGDSSDKSSLSAHDRGDYTSELMDLSTPICARREGGSSPSAELAAAGINFETVEAIVEGDIDALAESGIVFNRENFTKTVYSKLVKLRSAKINEYAVMLSNLLERWCGVVESPTNPTGKILINPISQDINVVMAAKIRKPHKKKDNGCFFVGVDDTPIPNTLMRIENKHVYSVTLRDALKTGGCYVYCEECFHGDPLALTRFLGDVIDSKGMMPLMAGIMAGPGTGKSYYISRNFDVVHDLYITVSTRQKEEMTDVLFKRYTELGYKGVEDMLRERVRTFASVINNPNILTRVKRMIWVDEATMQSVYEWAAIALYSGKFQPNVRMILVGDVEQCGAVAMDQKSPDLWPEFSTIIPQAGALRISYTLPQDSTVSLNKCVYVGKELKTVSKVRRSVEYRVATDWKAAAVVAAAAHEGSQIIAQTNHEVDELRKFNPRVAAMTVAESQGGRYDNVVYANGCSNVKNAYRADTREQASGTFTVAASRHRKILTYVTSVSQFVTDPFSGRVLLSNNATDAELDSVIASDEDIAEQSRLNVFANMDILDADYGSGIVTTEEMKRNRVYVIDVIHKSYVSCLHALFCHIERSNDIVMPQKNKTAILAEMNVKAHEEPGAYMSRLQEIYRSVPARYSAGPVDSFILQTINDNIVDYMRCGDNSFAPVVVQPIVGGCSGQMDCAAGVMNQLHRCSMGVFSGTMPSGSDDVEVFFVLLAERFVGAVDLSERFSLIARYRSMLRRRVQIVAVKRDFKRDRSSKIDAYRADVNKLELLYVEGELGLISHVFLSLFQRHLLSVLDVSVGGLVPGFGVYQVAPVGEHLVDAFQERPLREVTILEHVPFKFIEAPTKRGVTVSPLKVRSLPRYDGKVTAVDIRGVPVDVAEIAKKMVKCNYPFSTQIVVDEGTMFLDPIVANLQGYMPMSMVSVKEPRVLYDASYRYADQPYEMRYEPDINVLQRMIDVTYPDMAQPFAYKQLKMQDEPILSLKTKEGVTERLKREWDRLTPTLVGLAVPEIPIDRLSVKHSLMVRNDGAGEITVDRTVYDVAVGMFEDSKRLLFDSVKYDARVASTREYQEMVGRAQPQKKGVWRKLDTPSSFDNLKGYMGQLKASAKVDFEPNGSRGPAFPQVIAGSKPNFNARVAPAIASFTEKFLGSLRPNVCILMGHDQPTSGLVLRTFFDGIGVRLDGNHFYSVTNKKLETRCTEMDFSKFDKSQGLSILLFECMLLSHFGVEDEIVDLWFLNHYYTILTFRDQELTVWIETQRKSGDPFTFLGNCIVTALAILTLFKDGGLRGIVAYGDDSIAILDEGCAVKLDKRLPILPQYFNLAIKIARKKHVYAFSSFIVSDRIGGVHIVPDLLKMLSSRLCRMDLANLRHRDEYVIALRDNTAVFAYDDIVVVVAEALADRYDLPFNCYMFIHAIMSVIHSDAVYRLWYEEKGGIYNNDKSAMLKDL